jgi:hypothetical protein
MFNRDIQERDMKTRTTKHIGRTIKRFRSTWAELDYAQRRLLEIRTGVPMTQPAERSCNSASVEELEAWLALEFPRSRDTYR